MRLGAHAPDDFFACVVARRVKRRAPFCAPFAVWLSMMAVVGVRLTSRLLAHCDLEDMMDAFDGSFPFPSGKIAPRRALRRQVLGQRLPLAAGAQALFQMAPNQNNVAAAIFWMQACGGWREKHEVEATVSAEMRSIRVVTGVTRSEDHTDAELLRIAISRRGRMPGEPGEGR
ncbi:hypothetical protein GCM10011320_57880 [Neoroseomonas lacus]|uniref:Uncharacterized protein n=1 Tax=Neoroseomonas lacus TaxID=287609 RepID=A0A917NZ22_9PROT|nr:hypothetical protein GCM10011320_57880 [Neoroseomonas lacus]